MYWKEINCIKYMADKKRQKYTNIQIDTFII